MRLFDKIEEVSVLHFNDAPVAGIGLREAGHLGPSAGLRHLLRQSHQIVDGGSEDGARQTRGPPAPCSRSSGSLAADDRARHPRLQINVAERLARSIVAATHAPSSYLVGDNDHGHWSGADPRRRPIRLPRAAATAAAGHCHGGPGCPSCDACVLPHGPR